jgi:glycosyltransferase involved in cell wall biosynthesis
MSSVPEVSVIIPTRNRWTTLSRSALPAVWMQEDVSLDLVVVDDGSTDETQGGLETLERADVRVVRHEVSRGVAAARNTGIAHARGEWLAFLDDDDVWSPRKLRTQVDLAVKEGAGFVFSSAVIVDRFRQAIAYSAVPQDDDLARLLLWNNVVPGGCSNLVARAGLVRQLGGFDERLSMFADGDLWLRLALEAQGARCAEIHVGYLQHEDNMARRTSGVVFHEAAYLAAKHGRPGPARSSFDALNAIRVVGWENFWAGDRVRAGRIFLRAGLEYRSWRDVLRGGQFLVWALAPDSVSRSFWRLRHGLDVDHRPEAPSADWLLRYEAL